SVKTLDDFCADVLVNTNHVPVLFRVELAGQLGGVYEITEHDGELPSFSLWSLRTLLCLGSRRLCCLSRKRGCGRCFRSIPRPHEDSAIFICGELLCLDDLRLDGFEILVVEAEPYLEGRIRHTSLAFEERNDLIENVVKGHGAAPLARPRVSSHLANQR